MAGYCSSQGGSLCKIGHGFDPCFGYAVPWLVSRGYAVLSPNYRGSTGRGQQFISDMLGSAGSKDYSDVIDLLKFMIIQGSVGVDRAGIYGRSYGGYLAFLAVTAQRHSASLRRIIARRHGTGVNPPVL